MVKYLSLPIKTCLYGDSATSARLLSLIGRQKHNNTIVMSSPSKDKVWWIILWWNIRINCQNPNLTSTQHNGWVWHENDFANPTPPTTETQCQQYLSCYWPDFDETLKVGSCEHLEQIPTVRVTFVHATFVLATFVHIRNISAVTDPILMKL